jgi:hypothetical protein
MPNVHARRHKTVIKLDEIRDALRAAQAGKVGWERKVEDVLNELSHQMLFEIGEPVTFLDTKHVWRKGKVVSFMVHQPMYICDPGEGNDLTACSEEYIKRRGL